MGRNSRQSGSPVISPLQASPEALPFLGGPASSPDLAGACIESAFFGSNLGEPEYRLGGLRLTAEYLY